MMGRPLAQGQDLQASMQLQPHLWGLHLSKHLLSSRLAQYQGLHLQALHQGWELLPLHPLLLQLVVLQMLATWLQMCLTHVCKILLL